MLLPGVVYWIALRVNPIRCVYGDPACSLTVSTYLLGALTLLVFAATLVAALYAKKTFEHERLAALSVQRCTREGACPYEHRVFYLANPHAGFQSREPTSHTFIGDSEPRPVIREDWGEAGFDCMNVGKSPIVGAVLQMFIARGGRDADDVVRELSIGSIASGLSAHLVFHIVRDLDGRRIAIVNAGHKIQGLEFFPIETELEPMFRFPKPGPTVAPTDEPLPPPAPPPPRPPDVDLLARGGEVGGTDQEPVQHPLIAIERPGPAETTDAPAMPASGPSAVEAAAPGVDGNSDRPSAQPQPVVTENQDAAVRTDADLPPPPPPLAASASEPRPTITSPKAQNVETGGPPQATQTDDSAHASEVDDMASGDESKPHDSPPTAEPQSNQPDSAADGDSATDGGTHE